MKLILLIVVAYIALDSAQGWSLRNEESELGSSELIENREIADPGSKASGNSAKPQAPGKPHKRPGKKPNKKPGRGKGRGKWKGKKPKKDPESGPTNKPEKGPTNKPEKPQAHRPGRRPGKNPENKPAPAANKPGQGKKPAPMSLDDNE